MFLLVFILYFLSFLIIWQFVGYPTLMALIARRTKVKPKDYSYQPFVSILVPTYNEENVIGNRIENLIHLDYMDDNYEIIIVDSGSNDLTRDIVRKKIKENTRKPELKLIIENKRNGKASAINYGKNHAKGDIILVTDANSIFKRNVLKEMMPHFNDPKIGAVGGKYTLPNYDTLITSSNQFYLDIEYIMRKGESSIDSACLFHGEINAWRKNIVNADIGIVSEDLDMAIQIRKKKYKIEYEPKAINYEPAPTSIEDQIIQRKRNSIGTIKNIFKHMDYWLFPRDIYSLVIFPSHKGLVMFSPFILIAIPILYFLIMDLQTIVTHFMLVLINFTMLFLVLNHLKSKIIKSSRLKSGFSFKSLPKIVFYVLLNEYIVLLAWKDFIFGRYSVLWDKVESTREL
ncbi:glycosyltransferase [Methanobacterium sp.]|uniref:glycosyltransferase n=1 Tax=Methanobacterium sp. TaxID=2164 RepID=UPI003C736B1B